VSKVTGYGLDDRGLIPGRGRDFHLRHHIQRGCGASRPPIQLTPGALSTRVERQESEDDDPVH
jgi:hypothetical protein